MLKKTVQFLIITVIPFAASAENGSLEKLPELKIHVPPMRMEGTPPPPLDRPYLEPRKMPPPVVIVPEDVSNIALKKPVSSSDTYPLIGDVKQITDGEKGGGIFGIVELVEGLQWVQIDLLEESEIYAFAIWLDQRPETAAKGVVIQLSNDPDFKKDVKTVFNADYENFAGFGAGTDKTWRFSHLGKILEIKPAYTARYFRMYSNGKIYLSETNVYTEIEIYGRSLKNEKPAGQMVLKLVNPMMRMDW